MGPVLGVDACKAGWVGAVEGRDRGRVTLVCAPDIASLVEEASELGPLSAVAIDMPIGLADQGPRPPDALARTLLPARASSVFSTPVRPAVEALSYAEANRINLALAGRGVSKQAYALRTKLLEVDSFVRSAAVRVVEIHPEVSFARLAGRVLAPKRSWAGVVERMSGAGERRLPASTPHRSSRPDRRSG